MLKLLTAVQTNQKLIVALLAGVLVSLSIRAWLMIRNYAVNIMFVDQWDIFSTIFNHDGIVKIFSQQYGPHRQGMGGLIIWLVSSLTHWNTKIDAYVTFLLVLGACCAALLLKRIAFGKWSLSDIVIPIIFLTFSQFENFIITPNEAHSTFPLLGIMLWGLTFWIPNRILRYSLLLVMDFLTMFSGFGVFIGLVTPLILVIDLFRFFKARDFKSGAASAVSLVGSLLVVTAFFNHYIFAPAVGCFQVIPSYIPRYPIFMSVILSRFLSVNYNTNAWLAVGVGILLLGALVAVSLFYGGKLVLKKDGHSLLNQIIFAFSAYTIIFLANAALGRMCLGMGLAYTSRYVTLALPGIFAIYLALLSLKKTNWKSVLVGSFFLLMCVNIPTRASDIQILEYYTNGKNNWRECYLKLEDVKKCNDQTGFWVYAPYPMVTKAGEDQFYAKLIYLKNNQLNFFYQRP